MHIESIRYCCDEESPSTSKNQKFRKDWEKAKTHTLLKDVGNRKAGRLLFYYSMRSWIRQP
jgi:hypothetical protein